MNKRDTIGQHCPSGSGAPEPEPVAWMRDDGQEGSISTMAYCCSDKVRALWLKANPKQVERYTIPLYASPPARTPMTPVVRDALEMAHSALTYFQVTTICQADTDTANEALDMIKDALSNHGIGGK